MSFSAATACHAAPYVIHSWAIRRPQHAVCCLLVAAPQQTPDAHLEHQHALAGVCRQPVGQHTPCCAPTNDDVVILVSSCPHSNSTAPAADVTCARERAGGGSCVGKFTPSRSSGVCSSCQGAGTLPGATKRLWGAAGAAAAVRLCICVCIVCLLLLLQWQLRIRCKKQT